MNTNVEVFSMENMQKNYKVFNFSHTFMCIISGCIAGISGLTGVSGFILFLLAFVGTSCGLLLKMKMQLKDYTNSSKLHEFVFLGISTHGLSYVLFWTLSYALVHIY